MQFRTSRDIISWWVEREQGKDEFEVLDTNGWSGPKIAGIIDFTNNWSEQSQIIRLSPSTVRASYTWNLCYWNMDGKTKDVIKMYVQWMTDIMFLKRWRILDRSAHTENILLYGDNESQWTDYSDHVFFDNRNFPYDARELITIKSMLGYFIEMREEIPWYKEDMKPFFIDQLNEEFNKKWIELNIDGDSWDEEITDEIWRKYLSYKVYSQRQQLWYYPDKLKLQFDERYKKVQEKFWKDLKWFDKLFKKTVTQLIQKLTIIVGRKAINEEDSILLQETLNNLINWNYGLVFNLDNFTKLRKSESYNPISKPRSAISDFLLWFGLISDYLSEEIEMFENILWYTKLSEHESAGIKEKLITLKQRQKLLLDISSFNMPTSDIYNLLQDEDFFDKFVWWIYPK